MFQLIWESSLSTAPSNDGTWAVTMNTQKGECDRSLSSTITVLDGRINEQGLFARINGVIDESGKVALQVTRGPDLIAARGTVVGQQAYGSWNSPTRNCAGNWQAMRS
jgi:hypothetical protein